MKMIRQIYQLLFFIISILLFPTISWSGVIGSTVPADSTTDVSIITTVNVYLADSSVSVNDFTLTTGTGYNLGNVLGTYLKNGARVTFTPASSLSYNTIYTATIYYGIGYSFDSYSWTFTTGKSASGINYTVPADNTAGVSIITTINAYLADSSVSVNDFTVTTGTGYDFRDVSGTYFIINETTVIFTPVSNLDYNTTYIATIYYGIGYNFDSYSWTFTTGITSSGINYTVPLDNTTGVSISSAVNAYLADSSVSVNDFTLTTGTGYNFRNVSGTYFKNGTIVTFTPGTVLDYSTVYNATIYYGIGYSVDSYSWDFTTVIPGDIDNSLIIDLIDAIIVLKIVSGISSEADILTEANVTNNGRIGLEEAIFILKTVAELR